MTIINKIKSMKILYKYRYYLILIPIIILFIFFVPDCSNDKLPRQNKDTIIYKENKVNKDILKALNELNKLKLSYDSLKLRKPIIVIKYKTKYDSLIIADTSCQNSLIMLYNSFVELNDLNNDIIKKAEKRLINDSVLIENLNDKIKLSKQRIFIDSNYIARLEDTLSIVKRKGFFKGFKYGFLSGTLITGGTFSTLIIK